MTDNMYIKVIPELFTADRDSWRSTCEAMVSQMVSQIERHVDYVASCEIVTEEDNDGWISVKDRLPKNGKRCLVSVIKGGIPVVEEGIFAYGTFVYNTDNTSNYHGQYEKIIAWKPWPKPWEGD